MHPAPPAPGGPVIERFVRRLVAGTSGTTAELATAAAGMTGGASAVVLLDDAGRLVVAAHDTAEPRDRQSFGHVLSSLELDDRHKTAFVDAHPDLPLTALPASWRAWALQHEPLRSLAIPLSYGERILGWLWVGAMVGRDRADHLRDLAAVAGLRLGHERELRNDIGPLDLEAAMSARGDELEEAHQTVDRLAAVVGHDVRDAVRELLGWSRLGMEVDLDEGLRGELMAKIRRVAEQVGGMLGDVLEDVATVQAERDDHVAVDLNGILGWVRRVLADRIEAQHADLQVDPLPTILSASPTLLRAVLLELVRNAVEHGGAGVQVHLRVARVNGVVELVVEDNGPGIPAEDREAMFSAGVSTGAGVGLGLTRVRHGVKSMGGMVTAEESPSGGVAVHVVLPRKANRELSTS